MYRVKEIAGVTCSFIEYLANITRQIVPSFSASCKILPYETVSVHC